MSNYSDSAFDDNNANTSWYKAFHMIPEGSVVMDVGCSSGNFGKVLIDKKKCIVDGIEIDDGDYKKAQKKLRNVYQLNIETDSLTQIKAKYDVVYFGDVIEHLIDSAAALKRIKKILKPNGRLVFSVPNMAHATVRLQLLTGSFEYTETGLLDNTHLHFYTLDELTKVLTEAGYDIHKMDFVEKDYPNSLLKDYLSRVGLTPSDKFYKLMHKPDAAAFQFVGSAVPKRQEVKVKRTQFGPIDLFESYYNNTINPLKEHVKYLEGKVIELEARNKTLEKSFTHLVKRKVKTAARLVYSKTRKK